MWSLFSLNFWGLINNFSWLFLLLMLYLSFNKVLYILIVCTTSNLDHFIISCLFIVIVVKQVWHILYMLNLSRTVGMLYDNHWVFLLTFRLLLNYREFCCIRCRHSVLSVSRSDKQDVVIQLLLRRHGLLTLIAFSSKFMRSLPSILWEWIAQTTFHLYSWGTCFLKFEALTLNTISIFDLETSHAVAFCGHLLVMTVLKWHRVSLFLLKGGPLILIL